MTIRDRHAETHQLIAQGFEAIGEALVSLRYADRTTASGQRLFVLAGKLQALADDTENRAYQQAVMPKHLVESLLRNDACTQSGGMRENGKPSLWLGIGRAKLHSPRVFVAARRFDGSRLYEPRGDKIIRERKGAGLIPKPLAKQVLAAVAAPVIESRASRGEIRIMPDPASPMWSSRVKGLDGVSRTFAGVEIARGQSLRLELPKEIDPRIRREPTGRQILELRWPDSES